MVAAAAALCAWPVAGAGAGSDVSGARTVQIVFTGKGGGRYLDHTRWLHEVTRQCYASRLADETLSVRWRIEWTARLVPGPKGYVLRAPEGTTRSPAPSTGPPSRTNCDSAEEEPSWAGTSVCKSDLDLHTNGDVSVKRAAGGLRLEPRGPKYRSPGQPFELDIRNDQLVTSVALETAALARLAAGRALTAPVGTRHPARGVAYVPTRNCSHFPHLYDGVEYLYDCDDTLIWNGAVTIRAL